MVTTAEQMRTFEGPAILSYGFRPFFAQLDLKVLRKPYRPADLARAFRAALADRSRATDSGR